jgi:hypothetical protein
MIELYGSHITRPSLLQMSTRNRPQTLEILCGRDLHAQRIAIRLFFEGPRLFASHFVLVSGGSDGGGMVKNER